ncbi:unnamed protein product [Orchesella dallaii]|uniref:F-box domain-containing protein n=1 Tax=Orchesella dallaii TaxID=48710 RepID=A0ABP1R571_9HEXA
MMVILEFIFSFPTQDNFDSCIQVCDHWADVIEKTPKKSTWNPRFGKQVTADDMPKFRNTSGSKFEKVDYIVKMRKQISKFPPSERALLRTMVFCGVSVKFLETLAKAYGQQIQSLTLGPYTSGGLAKALEKFHNLKIFKAFELCNAAFYTGRFKHLGIRHVSINKVKPFNDNPLV